MLFHVNEWINAFLVEDDYDMLNDTSNGILL